MSSLICASSRRAYGHSPITNRSRRGRPIGWPPTHSISPGPRQLPCIHTSAPASLASESAPSPVTAIGGSQPMSRTPAAVRLSRPRAGVVQALKLVLRQRLGREQIERRRVLGAQKALEHRQVVAQALAARGAGHDDGVEPAAERLDRLHLVRVEAFDAVSRERVGERLGQRQREVTEARRPRGESLMVDERTAVFAALGPVADQRIEPRVRDRVGR